MLVYYLIKSSVQKLVMVMCVGCERFPTAGGGRFRQRVEQRRGREAGNQDRRGAGSGG